MLIIRAARKVIRHSQFLVAMALAACVANLLQVPAHAVAIKPFADTYTSTIRGDFAMAGNTVVSCSNEAGDQGSATCSSARLGQGVGLDNDQHNMTNSRDVFTGPPSETVLNASSSELNLPAEATIVFAELVWSGTLFVDAGDSNAHDSTKVGHVLAYAEGHSCVSSPSDCRISAPTSHVVVENVGGQDGQYRASADVTAQLSGSEVTWVYRNGQRATQFHVGNVQTAQGIDKAAGWGLIVAYSDPHSQLRHIEIQDGFAVVANRSPYSLVMDGMLTPTVGENHQAIGVISFDGDRGSATDSITLVDGSNRAVLSDPLNPANNVENSAVTSDGLFNTHLDNSTIGRYRNTFGTDVEKVSLINGLTPGATSATISMTSSNDTYFPAAVVMSSEVGSANLGITKVAAGLNGASITQLQPGDTLRYEFTVANNGNGVASDVELNDLLPNDFTMVSSTGTDCATVPSGSLCKSLGSLAAGSSAIIEATGTANGSSIGSPNHFENAATVSWTSLGQTMESTSEPVTVAYGAQNADLMIALKFTHDFIQAGHATYLDVAMTNLGTQADAHPTVTLGTLKGVKFPNHQLPPGCVGATKTRIVCDASAFGVTNADPLSPGSTVHLRIAVVPPTKLHRETVIARVSASTAIGDSNLHNNFARATVLINHPPVAEDVFILTTVGARATQVNLLGYIFDPDSDSLHISIQKPIHGSASLVGPVMNYVPPANWTGSLTYRYYVFDGLGGKTWATVHVTITRTVIHNCLIRFGC